jgi:NAD(P)-dependent dehydrogenase (short-subunit alcohol dehydrogenase family)
MNVMEMFSLKGKVALVTGAGNKIGYGAQCAEALYEAGADCLVAGNAVFSADDMIQTIADLKK